MIRISILCAAFFLSLATVADDESLPLVDAHIHYSHDAWDMLPPDRAVSVLREAGLKRAFISSSSDDGTQKLYDEAPDLVVPVLRPYRKRGELSSWMHDETVVDMLQGRLEKYRYAGIGEFHAFGDDIELPVLRHVIALAKQYDLFLHAHSDADAVDRIFKENPDARVLWAHSGFDSAYEVRELLKRHDNLWCDLAFRYEHADGDRVDEDWRALFMEFPDRFMIGTDTYTPERWFYVVEHADWSRGWLANLPDELAKNIAFRNAEKLIANFE